MLSSTKFTLTNHTIEFKKVRDHILSKFLILCWTVFSANESKHGLWLGILAQNIKGSSLTQQGRGIYEEVINHIAMNLFSDGSWYFGGMGSPYLIVNLYLGKTVTLSCCWYPIGVCRHISLRSSRQKQN